MEPHRVEIRTCSTYALRKQTNIFCFLQLPPSPSYSSSNICILLQGCSYPIIYDLPYQSFTSDILLYFYYMPDFNWTLFIHLITYAMPVLIYECFIFKSFFLLGAKYIQCLRSLDLLLKIRVSCNICKCFGFVVTTHVHSEMQLQIHNHNRCSLHPYPKRNPRQ